MARLSGWKARHGESVTCLHVSKAHESQRLVGFADPIMQNSEIAAAFDELADLLEIQGANPFRLRAYRNAARMLRDLTEPAADRVDATEEGQTLEDLPGIGADLAEKIANLVETGSLPQLEELRENVPPGVLDILRLPGLGPKKAAVLFETLGVASLADLKKAAEENRIAGLKGFGKKTQESILANIEGAAQAAQRMLFASAVETVETILADLRALKSVKQVDVAGSFRRRRETIGDLDLLATSSQPETVMDELAGHELVADVLQRGPTKMRVRLRIGLEMDLRVLEEKSYGAGLVYFTGSKAHNIVLRRRAQSRDLKINEYGVFRGKNEKLVAGKTEEEVYAAVDLPWIPPELREDRGEFELAESGKLPKLITIDDIRGDLHMHTTATDGMNSLREMAEAAKEFGHDYIAITDHSRRVTMAGGLDPKRLRAQWKEIDQLNEELKGITVLKGVECDILENATMDLPEDVLAEADWVLGVLHYGLTQPRGRIMERLLMAIKHPSVDAIGHPTGRLVGKRAGADIDLKTFLAAAKQHGVLLEINASPQRLDLDDVQARAAHEQGIPIVINTDSHRAGGFHQMQYGVNQARRAGLDAAAVANTRTLAKFRKLLVKRK